MLVNAFLHGWGKSGYYEHNRAGNHAYSQGDYAGAAKEYGQMIALRPHRIDGFLLRGMAYDQEGLCVQAIADDTAGLALTSNPVQIADFYYNRAGAEAKIGRLSAAVADFTGAEHHYLQNGGLVSDQRIALCLHDTYQQRAKAYAGQKAWAQAVADYTVEITRYNPSPADYALRAQAEIDGGQNATAQQDLEQLIRVDPANIDAYIHMGNFWEKTHQYAKGVALWTKAIQVLPHNTLYLVRCEGNLGWCQYEAGQMPQAIRSDQAALAQDNSQEWIHYNLALCFAMEGDQEKASAAYTDALAHTSESDRQAALGDITHALNQRPDSAALLQAKQMLTNAAHSAS